MEKFTKGGWDFDQSIERVVSAEGETICATGGSWGSYRNSDANAALIAAAPEMYEMLQKTADELLFMIRKANSDMMQAITSTDESEPEYYDEQTVFDIMQLLSKARGEK